MSISAGTRVFRKAVGRPRVFTDDELDEAIRFAPQRPASRRGRQDAAYCLRAVLILASVIDGSKADPADREHLLWFGDPGDPRTWRRSMLAELGRFRDPRLLVAAAVEVARSRPALPLVREVVPFIRRVRKELEP